VKRSVTHQYFFYGGLRPDFTIQLWLHRHRLSGLHTPYPAQNEIKYYQTDKFLLGCQAFILPVSVVQQDIYGHHDRVDPVKYDNHIKIEKDLMQ
jgi:hypothetical protein